MNNNSSIIKRLYYQVYMETDMISPSKYSELLAAITNYLAKIGIKSMVIQPHQVVYYLFGDAEIKVGRGLNAFIHISTSDKIELDEITATITQIITKVLGGDEK